MNYPQFNRIQNTVTNKVSIASIKFPCYDQDSSNGWYSQLQKWWMHYSYVASYIAIAIAILDNNSVTKEKGDKTVV